MNTNMNCCKLCFTIVFSLFCKAEPARILTVLQIPSQSHNIVFRPLLEELLKHGHQITVVSVNPMFTLRQTHENLTEIDIHNASYSFTRQHVIASWSKKKDPLGNMRDFYTLMAETFINQIQTPEVQKIIKDESEKFDLLFLDSTSRISTALSHVFNVPVIRVGTTGAVERHNHILGVPTHFLLYPQCFRHRLYDLTIWEKIKELYIEYRLYKIQKETEEYDNLILKRIFGPDMPPIAELQKNVDMFFYGDQPIWEDNRPIPPSVIYIGGINKLPERQLPEDIKTYLDTSNRDVIYVSFGNNINTLDLPQDTVQLLTKVFANLPYNICWKWDSDEFPGKSPNIRTFKWLPQADFLRHPKVRLFITHGGLRSTEDAIEAGVPLIGMPMFLDQFFNSEKYVRHGIGIKLDRETLTEVQLISAIQKIMGNKSYQENVIKLRTIMNDQPMSSLERAVWWTEHVLRHGGARHLRAPAANMGWAEYYELQLVLTVLITVFSFFALTILCIFAVMKSVMKKKPKKKMF